MDNEDAPQEASDGNKTHGNWVRSHFCYIVANSLSTFCSYFETLGRMFKQDGIFTLAESALGQHSMRAMAQVSLAALSQAYSRNWKEEAERGLYTVQWLEEGAADKGTAAGVQKPRTCAVSTGGPGQTTLRVRRGNGSFSLEGKHLLGACGSRAAWEVFPQVCSLCTTPKDSEVLQLRSKEVKLLLGLPAELASSNWCWFYRHAERKS